MGVKRTAITYGTFDLFHVGHLRLLKRMRKYADKTIVAVSLDSFNEIKGKKTVISYEERAEIVSSIEYVDIVIPEWGWDQKIHDINEYNVDVFIMGSDWEGHFSELKEHCEVIYLDRTIGVSSSDIKNHLCDIHK